MKNYNLLAWLLFLLELDDEDVLEVEDAEEEEEDEGEEEEGPFRLFNWLHLAFIKFLAKLSMLVLDDLIRCILLDDG